jgi:hypothetical protein
MSTVRRLYFYGLAYISAGVVIWGLVNLLRTLLSGRGSVEADTLATGLSLVLVGAPIFWMHWRIARRDAIRDPEERASRILAIFLYGTLLGTLIPIIYGILALVNRAAVALFGLRPQDAWFGGQGTGLDNLVAVLINAGAFFFFWRILRADWLEDLPEHFLRETRRFYHYALVILSLVIFVAGVYNILRYLLQLLSQPQFVTLVDLAAGISLLIVGAPLWYFFWGQAQFLLADPYERGSLLRLVVLYLISLAAVVGVLTTAGGVINTLIRYLLGQYGLSAFFQTISGDVAALVPLAVLWAYYGRILGIEVGSQSDLPRQAALRRLYYYILALLGLGVVYVGLFNLASLLARLAFAPQQIVDFRDPLSGSLSSLLVGLPLWLNTWPIMQKAAARSDDFGDHARRSVLRKAYLYLVLFVLVISAMTVVGQFLYNLLYALLGQASDDLARQLTELVLWMVIILVLFPYHWNALRRDGQLAQQTLGNLHAQFPTLILAEEGPSDEFADAALHSLQRIAPRLPVVINHIERGIPDESMLAARAIVMPVEMALHPPEPLRLWLSDYQGSRILVPLPREGWFWLGQTEKGIVERGREAAQTLRQMAEGEALRQSLPGNPWAIAGYILGGVFGLILLGMVFSLMISSVFR